MKEIGLFYAMNAAKTSHIAEKIREKLGHKEVEMIMIEKAWQNDFQAYDNLIVGASTWFDGELQSPVGARLSSMAGAKYNLSNIGLDAHGSWSKTEVEERNKKNSNWECYIKALGGSTSGTTITLAPEQGPSFSINLGA